MELCVSRARARTASATTAEAEVEVEAQHFLQAAQIQAPELRSFDCYTPKKALYGIFRAAFNSAVERSTAAPLGFGSCRVPAPSLTTTHTKL